MDGDEGKTSSGSLMDEGGDGTQTRWRDKVEKILEDHTDMLVRILQRLEHPAPTNKSTITDDNNTNNNYNTSNNNGNHLWNHMDNNIEHVTEPIKSSRSSSRVTNKKKIILARNNPSERVLRHRLPTRYAEVEESTSPIPKSSKSSKLKKPTKPKPTSKSIPATRTTQLKPLTESMPATEYKSSSESPSIPLITPSTSSARTKPRSRKQVDKYTPCPPNKQIPPVPTQSSICSPGHSPPTPILSPSSPGTTTCPTATTKPESPTSEPQRGQRKRSFDEAYPPPSSSSAMGGAGLEILSSTRLMIDKSSPALFSDPPRVRRGRPKVQKQKPKNNNSNKSPQNLSPSQVESELPSGASDDLPLYPRTHSNNSPSNKTEQQHETEDVVLLSYSVSEPSTPPPLKQPRKTRAKADSDEDLSLETSTGQYSDFTPPASSSASSPPVTSPLSKYSLRTTSTSQYRKFSNHPLSNNSHHPSLNSTPINHLPQSPSSTKSPHHYNASSSPSGPSSPNGRNGPRSPNGPDRQTALNQDPHATQKHMEYNFSLLAPIFGSFVKNEDELVTPFLKEGDSVSSAPALDHERMYCDSCSTTIPDRHWSFAKAHEVLSRSDLTSAQHEKNNAAKEVMAALKIFVKKHVAEKKPVTRPTVTCHRCRKHCNDQVCVRCHCKRKFCSSCLEAQQVPLEETTKSGWSCPMCLGTCNCRYCRDSKRREVVPMRDNDFSFELCLDCGVEWFRNEKKILPGQNKDKKLAPKEVMDSMVLQRVIPLASYSDTVQKFQELVSKGQEHMQIDRTQTISKHGIGAADRENLGWFQKYWISGVPVVIQGCRDKLKLQWSPEEFMKKCGVEKHDMIDCRDNAFTDQVTVAEFFAGYLSFDKRRVDKGQKMRLKLKDWPSGEDFSQKLPEHFVDLMQALPFSEYVKPDGVLNLISALPINANKPDLGPKCYIAYEDTSTSLHFDMSDAVNLLVHIGPLPPPTASAPVTPTPTPTSTSTSPATLSHLPAKPLILAHPSSPFVMQSSPSDNTKPSKTAGALWHIFRREDVSALSTFLNRTKGKGEHEEGHTILDHSIYMDSDMLEALAKECNIFPHVIYQEEGDAVFIPAGCPHQVKNIRCCIKVAEDFVSPENLEHCIKLTDQFRKLPPDHKFRGDRLGVRIILYHAMEKAVNMLVK